MHTIDVVIPILLALACALAVPVAIHRVRCLRARRPPDQPSSNGTSTEFCAEVVRVTEVLAHPNADRLEIAHFELASGPSTYDVVIGKGTFAPGDLAAYFSVDCILPLARPEFAFLARGTEGKTHHRLRAARLRGTFSQGLMVPAPAGSRLGDSLAQSFGVTYHQSAEELEADAPARNKPSAAPQCLPTYGVDSLKKMPSLFAAGEAVAVTEKVHGCNLRAAWVRRRILGIRCGWKFVVGSHRVIKDPDAPQGSADLWLDAARIHSLREKLAAFKGLAFYGEVFGLDVNGKKVQDLTYGKPGPALVIFDIRQPDGSWLPFHERKQICDALGLEHAPVLFVGSWDASLRDLAEGRSLIAPEQIREGVVVEALSGERRKAKYVGQGYLLRKEAAS